MNPRDERTDFEELRDTRIYRHSNPGSSTWAHVPGYEEGLFAISTGSTKAYNSLKQIPGLVPKNGCVLLFRDSMLDTVATAVRARHRPQYSPDQLAALQEKARMARGFIKKD